jgi:protein-tyrosine phosphatase
LGQRSTLPTDSQVVLDKILATRGPKDLPGGARWADHPSSGRDFSPAHLAEVLEQFDVRAVVRLSLPSYSTVELEAAGVAVVDLCFPDCTTPPPPVAVKFLMLAEAVPGALAVHCLAGLGRTGTLVGLWLMKHRGFTARAAMGWLRVVRPGSVIGQQQQYLCEMEAAMKRAGEEFRRRGGPGVPVAGRGVAGVHEAFEQVRVLGSVWWLMLVALRENRTAEVAVAERITRSRVSQRIGSAGA